MSKQPLDQEALTNIRFALAVLNRGNSIVLNKGEKEKIRWAARIVEIYGIQQEPGGDGDWFHPEVNDADS